ncbi:MAG: SIS domain-containing protein [Acidobacteriaceae bacterium]
MSNDSNNHYVLQEILSQPESWRQVLALLQEKNGPSKKIMSLIDKGPVVFAGCGSSYYLSLAASPLWNSICEAPVRAASASDLIMYPEGYWGSMPGTLIAVSRSGKTMETCEAARYARDVLGWRTIAVTCYPDTPLVELCDEALVLADAAEVSRFTTRALTAMVLSFEMLAALHSDNVELQHELLQLPEHASRLLARYGEQIEELSRLGDFEGYVYLGQGPYFGIASELMLKIKEMTCSAAEAYSSLEYLHGPRYAATASTLIVVLLSDGGRKYQLELLPKLKDLGATILVVCEHTCADISANADIVFELESGLSDYGRMLLMMPLLQLFAYYRALAVGKSDWIEKMVKLPAMSSQVS